MDALTPLFRSPSGLGAAYHAEALEFLGHLEAESVDLILTSPPFALQKGKAYGNIPAEEYVAWFSPFAKEFHRVLKPRGSLVIDIGGGWQKGLPVKHVYQYELLLHLVKEGGFYLAQEFFWWNPSRLPTPAEWVTVRRIRVKDTVNTIWWLAKTPYPKASNRRILQPYSPRMRHLLEKGYKPKRRPSGHQISSKFAKENSGAIPPQPHRPGQHREQHRLPTVLPGKGPAGAPCPLPGPAPGFFHPDAHRPWGCGPRPLCGEPHHRGGGRTPGKALGLRGAGKGLHRGGHGALPPSGSPPGPSPQAQGQALPGLSSLFAPGRRVRKTLPKRAGAKL